MLRKIGTRRDFTKDGILAGLVGTVIYMASCGSSNKSSSSGGGSSDVSGTVANNHGHVATITAAQLSGGTDITLDIRGTADHTHSLSITAAQLTTLKGGGQVSVTSTTGGSDSHTHTVSFTGQASAPSPSNGGW